MQEGILTGRADIHIHSMVGDGMAKVPDLLEYVEHCTGLDVIAITDHDDIGGGYRAREHAGNRRYRFEVIVGAEVTTKEGHLLALFLERPVRSLQSLAKTIDDIHEQGGICIVPHPMSWLTRSVGQRALERILRSASQGLYFDGIETVNATIAGKVCAEKVTRLNERRYHLPETGGSDAHFLTLVGTGYTLFEGKTAGDLRRSLERGTTSSHLDTGRGLGSVGISEIVGQQFRSLILMPSRRVRRKVRRLLKGRGG